MASLRSPASGKAAIEASFSCVRFPPIADIEPNVCFWPFRTFAGIADICCRDRSDVLTMRLIVRSEQAIVKAMTTDQAQMRAIRLVRPYA